MHECGCNNKTLAQNVGVSGVTIGRWKNGNGQLKLGNALKLANFFGCSLEFLMGRSDTPIDFVPQPCPPFYKHLRELLYTQGISRNKLNRDTPIKSSHFVDWKNGRDPQLISLIQLADYLGVTLDRLVGREK